jgi:serine/threonine protein kinase/Tfp pilus assembly protein PilF
MQPAPQEISTCPTCGGTLEETSSSGLGCMVCLLRVGIGGEDSAGAGQDSTPNPFEGDERFGVYEIERREDGTLYELGRGAMGITYRAIDTSLQRKVALKIIKTGIAGRSGETRERFMREARTAAALRHENIATVFQFGIREETGQCFYAMELIEGETLEERVRRTGPLGVRNTIDIAEQVTAALAAAEKRGLIHRDLKPANLMLVSPDEETVEAAPSPLPCSSKSATRASRLFVKIIDFGLAKALNAPVDPMSLTRGGFVGTPAFASPEQFDLESIRGALDVRSDIYSLGVTLWFALTGKTPFGGRSVEEIRRAQQSRALPIEQLKAARVPSRLRSLLESMLAVEPAARPGTKDLLARLRRCSAQANPEGFRHIHVALAAVVILILGMSAFFVFPSLRTRPAAAASASHLAPPEKSIAVLPFENLSNDREDAFFADGVQDDILTNLAKIADLKVISRTSVRQYRDQHNARGIGDALRVSHVLEGSVRKTGAWLHINAQLIDTRTDTHVWAEQYDRDLKDLFAVQSEIAQKVAGQLHAKISPAERLAIERSPTADLAAFDLYSRAKNLLLDWSYSTNERDNLLQEAADLLNQAVAHDPTFFQPYCQLAWIHDQLYFVGFDRTPGRLALAEAAIRAAFRLRPDAGEAHLARAVNLYRGYLDYEGALAELEVARQTLPNDARLFELKGYIERRRPGGNEEEALRDLERAIELDPRNILLLQQTAFSYRDLRHYAEQEAVLDRALTIEPDKTETKVLRAYVEFNWKADTRPLHRLIDEIRAKDPGAIQNMAEDWLVCALAERDPTAAGNALAALGENSVGTPPYKFSPHFVRGLIGRMTKDDLKARSDFAAARADQEKLVRARPHDAGALCVLGLIDAALERKEEALREGRRAVELLPVERDASDGKRIIMGLARIAAWVDDKDLACEQLGVAVRPPSPLSYGDLKLLPWWDPLRGDPRFEKIVASLAPKEN